MTFFFRFLSAVAFLVTVMGYFPLILGAPRPWAWYVPPLAGIAASVVIGITILIVDPKAWKQ